MMSGLLLALASGWCWGAAGLGYRPFLDPLPVDRWWPLSLIPVALAVAVVHRAIRDREGAFAWKKALWLAAQVAGFLWLGGVVLWLLHEWL